MDRIKLKLAAPASQFFRAKNKQHFQPDWATRRALIESCIDPSANDSRALQALLGYTLLTMPTYYLEGFGETLERVHRELKNTRTLIFSIEFCRKPQVAIAFAYIKARGGLLIGCQHGGLYGQTDPTWPERLENRISDLYLTWGYRYNKHHAPMPSVRLSRKRIQPRPSSKHKDAVLLVAPYLADYLEFAIHSPSITHQAEALNRSLSMVEGLLNSGQRVILRCHPRNTEADLQPILPLLRHPNLSVLKGSRGELANDCRDYKFTLFSSPNATGLSELSAENIPFRIIAAEASFWIQPKAMPVYQRLITSGIWVTEGSVTPEMIDATMVSKRQDEALAEFGKQFACRSDRYTARWAKLIRLASKAGNAEEITIGLRV